MKKPFDFYEPYMRRPIIHMVFTRFILALFIVESAVYFLSPAVGRPIRGTVCLLAAVFFGLMAWIVYLRMDGLQLPKLMMMRINPRKKPSRTYGDMIDYIDEKPEIGFEDLDDNEKDLCILAADLFCCIVFLIAALFIRG